MSETHYKILIKMGGRAGLERMVEGLSPEDFPREWEKAEKLWHSQPNRFSSLNVWLFHYNSNGKLKDEIRVFQWQRTLKADWSHMAGG